MTSLQSITSDEESFLGDSLEQVLKNHKVEAPNEDKGLPAIPSGLQLLLKTLDRALGRHGAALLIGSLRQAYRYLNDNSLREKVQRTLSEQITKGPTLLVGHSLGSVVALEYIRCSPEGERLSLVTLGSPLGLHSIQQRLKVPYFGSDTQEGLPPRVGYWANIRDPRDPATCYGDIGDIWRGVRDGVVNNGADAHSVTRYLCQRLTGHRLLEALQLAPQVT
jgi:pimeloyl-ACP methyl ester carboxylesterase